MSTRLRRIPGFLLFSALILLCSVLRGPWARPAAVRGAGVPITRVRLQLKWVPQAQFAGYYLAQARGYYAAEGLDVTILPGGPDVTPEDVVAAGDADFGIDWLSSLLTEREQGLDLVNIAQLFHRSSLTELAWRDSGISTIADLRGRRVGVWCCGNQYALFAALRQVGIDPADPADVQIVDQPFDMDLLLQRQVDAAAATTYNELGQVLETTNPATGRLYTPADLTVLRMEDAGTGMLEDGLFTTGSWLADADHRDVAIRFLRASLRGWIGCRDAPEACVQVTLAQGTALGAGHQEWMLNEVNALIWPAPLGIGVMDPASYAQTVAIAQASGVIGAAPAGTVYRDDLVRAALLGVPEDTVGADWRKATVPITPGGR
jgi:NitT/TauT family transport system substrate-binding protein